LLSRSARPDGIVCASDSIASGVLEAARDLGIAVPTDLEVSGFDDATFATHTTPPLTTVRMPLQQLGAATIEMLVALIEGTGAQRHLILPTTLVQRGSTLRHHSPQS
jgi:LacI family transcriptional regulator